MLPPIWQIPNGDLFQQQDFLLPTRVRVRRRRPIPQVSAVKTVVVNSVTRPPATTLIFVQAIPLAVWTINHNTGQFPSVTVVDPAGNVVLANVQYVSSNQVVVSFSQPFAGKAYLNI